MKVTFVLPTLDLTGGVRVVSIYARGLLDKGHAVNVFVASPKPRSIRQAARDLLRHGLVWPNRPAVKGSHFEGLGIELQFLDWSDAVAAQSFPPADVLIGTWWETMEWVIKAPETSGKKLYLIQGHEVFPGLPIHRVQATYKTNSVKVAVSRWIENILLTEYDATNVVVINNAVDGAKFNATNRKKGHVPTLGFVYSSIEFKGSKLILSVIGEVRKFYPNLKVFAFGSKRPSNIIPLDEKVSFRFQPPQAEIPEIYRACDVWLCASESEGFNLPAMEAMSCGTPVISTRTGWPVEAIKDGINGYLADIGDAGMLVQRTLDVLGFDSERWSTMSIAAQATAGTYTWEKSISAFEEACMRCIGMNASAEDFPAMRSF